jgi:diguanylate cyclase (GGDEF)-like protein
MAGIGADRPAWRHATLTASVTTAAAVIIAGPLLDRPPDDWRWVAVALASAIFAQFGALTFRQGNRNVLFAWGEAGLIVVVYNVPTGWVAPIIGLGWVVGHSLYVLRTGGVWTRRRLLNGTNITVAGAVGALATRAVWMADHRGALSLRLLAGLLLGAVVYTTVAAVLVAALLVTTTDESFWRFVRRTLLGKAPMVAGNATIGLVVVAVIATAPQWLLLVPPLVIAVHQLYVYRSREADGRRIWREFAEFGRSLHQLDERAVAIAGVEGTLGLFQAAAVEVWVERLAGAVRGFRGTPDAGSPHRRVNLTALNGTSSDWLTPASASRALSIDGVRVGELRLWTVGGVGLDSRDQIVLSAVADALAASLHDAAAHRALRTLAARTFHDARHDTLTGVPNRAALMREGAEMVAAIPADGYVSLVVLGIDRFKDVNDTLGHLAGDDLLRTTAGRLAAFVVPGELLARIGGDEFAILSPVQASDDDPGGDLLIRAHRLADELAVPVEISGMQVAVEVSVGVALARAGECDLVELVRRANTAMYRAKRGAGPVVAFDVDTRPGEPSGVERLSVLVEMREALGREDQLVLAVQPALDLRTGRPIGGEVLIRWQHPRRGMLAPCEFLDVVDHSDLVIPFTRYVLDRALRLAREWRWGGVPMPVSVNLSPRSLADPTLAFDVATMLTRYQIEPEMLILEITESAAATAQVTGILADLRAIGVQLAVDDFGTGYSSLAYLRRLPVDEVKIDRSFVQGMATDPGELAIVRAVVDLARHFELRVVAEGVESERTLSLLADMGCDIGQGFLFSRPLPYDRLEAWLAAQTDTERTAKGEVRRLRAAS